MTHKEIRKKFLDFFEKNGHKIVPSSSLLPQNDSSVLLTTAGMQQFKPYYLETGSPYGNRATSIQKCFRTSSIDEIGDERHLTFFEMLGNFSFKYSEGENSYFKEKAIKMAYEFITKEMGLGIDYVTVFHGDKKAGIPKDEESVKIWKKIGIPEDKIKYFGREDNFWGPTGDEGPCGPTTEIYINGIEIWNIVFNEYYYDKNGNFTKLRYQGIDTGMGLERLAMVSQKKQTIFETDLFSSIMDLIFISVKDKKTTRVISDHIRGAVFLITDGLFPSNVGVGYILRRILRRAVFSIPKENEFIIASAAKIIINEYGEFYPELKKNESLIFTEIEKELLAFKKSLDRGIKEFRDLKEFRGVSRHSLNKSKEITGKDAFKVYETYGLPLELFFKTLKKEGFELTDSKKENIFKEFSSELLKHQEISKAGLKKKFGGHGIIKTQNTKHELQTNNEKIVKLHTATHLLQAALREILGNEVKQMGSDINEERLRFDFTFQRKLTENEKIKIEDLVNRKIQEKLEVKKEEMSYNKAINSGALAFFKEKYPETVSVYSAGDFSKEICGGPHIKNTGELGKFKIVKEESSSAGVRRIKAILE